MQEAFLSINGIKTNVLTCGRWVEEKPTSDEEHIILVIPGNPGITGFYKTFMLALHDYTKYPVWILSHAGHEIPPLTSSEELQSFKKNPNVYGLQGQIEHKVQFIKTYVPKNAHLHLIGHSIGGYICLELLKNENIRGRLANLQLLFPTIEDMAQTSNGRFFSTYVKHLVRLILFLSLIYTLIPTIVRNFLTYIYMKITSLPKIHFENVVTLVHPSVLEKVFSLAFEELNEVCGRNNQVIKQNFEKISIWYGENDGWAPVSYCNRIKVDFPEINAQICRYDHAFVLNQSCQIARLIYSSILME